MVFHGEFLILDDDTVLAIKFIESIKYPDTEANVVDVLKNDLHFEVITVSGNRYTVSVNKQNKYGVLINTSEFRDAIYYRWRHIITH